MAKHLIEGRAFPLFFYGQTFLLGLEAWIAAPFLLVGGVTVGALHAAILSINLAIAALLIVCLMRAGAGAVAAVGATVFFTFAPPFTAAMLGEANGCNVEPFLFVVLLWLLRDRPLWFGAVLGIGVLTREFTIYAVPALLLIQGLTGDLFRTERLRGWLLAGAAFLAVWQTVDALKPVADLMGPGTRGEPVPGPVGSAVDNLLFRLNVAPSELADRAAAMAREYFPRQVGARRIESPVAPQGYDAMFWPLAIALAVVLARGLYLSRRAFQRDGELRPAFAWFLVGVGLASAAGYVLTRPVDGGPVDRYMLLTIYVPVGLAAVVLALEPRPWVRRGLAALLVVWAASSGLDHARLAAHYWRGQPDEAQALADGLAARGIEVAAAGYWRAYKLTYLTGERVKIASTDVSRIAEYDRLAQAQGDRLIVLRPEPCDTDQPPLNGWYLCRVGE
jgi:hypothetical protein